MKPEHSVTVTAGNTELPKDAFVVSGYDVRGKISSDGVQNIGFLLFNAKNVSSSNSFSSRDFVSNSHFVHSNGMHRNVWRHQLNRQLQPITMDTRRNRHAVL